jgi:exopolysaccharide biosynthesis polyprenyl glycosylphosphotransferase
MRSEREWEFLVTSFAIVDKDMVGEYICGIPVIADKDSLFEVVTQGVVDEVFISVPFNRNLKLDEIILEFENMGITVNLSITTFDLNINEKTIKYFGGYHVLTFSTKVFNKSAMVLKRGIDIIGAIIGLLITTLTCIILAPAILLESPGPLIFSQLRVGKNGRRFKIYKFRSMYIDAEARKMELMELNEMEGLMFKLTNDPRITKVGKFIRKTSIDELPQFFNVLKGDMSLVGTRPPTEDEFLQYESRHKRRLTLKPGITGLWQVSGRSDIDNFEDVVKMDLEYIDNWSFLMDIKLLVRTVIVVLFRVGAK